MCVDGNRDVLTCVGNIICIALDMFSVTFSGRKTAVDQVGRINNDVLPVVYGKS